MEILEKKNSHTIYLSSHLKNLEKDEQNKSKASRKKEIININNEDNIKIPGIETIKTKEKINERVGYREPVSKTQ